MRGDMGARVDRRSGSRCRARGSFPTRASTSPRTCCAAATTRRRSSSAARSGTLRVVTLGGALSPASPRSPRRCARPASGRRSRRRLHAQRARGDCRRARRGRRRRRVVVVLAGFRRPGRARPVRADRAARARRRRRLRLRRQTHDCRTQRRSRLPRPCRRSSRSVVIPYAAAAPPIGLARARPWSDFIASARRSRHRCFEPLPFNHPLYILYSSGTTGVPKCIVHGAGGTLIQHLKEHQLHCDIRAGDRVFYFTTCGWMMWNWLVTALASDATLAALRRLAVSSGRQRRSSTSPTRRGMTLFGTSAKFIDAVAKAGLAPTRDASALRPCGR